ncbi:c-type cytochrome biogenesis protein CcmI [Thioalkalicoccus limnaeus]|uniref:C-type cytochrome biogenesis protein CcmI n=1 Tax=Thioalkalicoccus limnaeus TaxID=120681 RepID=A0ABV4BB33_9GAMM
MIVFWIFAAGLAGLALVFVVPALVNRRPISAGIAQDELNLAVFRQQLGELDRDLSAGNLSQDQYDSARRDLERELLSDLDATDAPAVASSNQRGRWIAVVLAVVVPAGAVLLYLQIGANDIIPRLEAAAPGSPGAALAHGGSGESLSLEVLVQRLHKRLDQNPKDVDGWLLLGRTYYTIDKPNRALGAFQRAFDLAPDNPEVMLAYAQGLAIVGDGNLEGAPAELIRKVLAIEPDNVGARWMEGMLAYERRQYNAAVLAWEWVLARMDPASEDADELRRSIADARHRAGGPPAVGPSADQSAAADEVHRAPEAAAAGVTVSVNLDESLWFHAAADDALFIYARAVDGPPMPLAATRARVIDLPLTIRLDDSMAMLPERPMSQFDEVMVGARISKSGSATAQAGDLEGEVGPIRIGDGEPVTLIIDRERR